MTEIHVDQIVVGDRARRDYGDMSDLIESIREHGILSPITLMPGNRLLCGGRRLAAAQHLGLVTVPFHVAHTQDDAVSRLRAERDENTCRKEMTVSERVALARQIEELEKPAAAERQGSRTDLTSGSTEPEVAKVVRSAEVAADAVGMSRVTYQRAKFVLDTAEDPNVPEPVREVAQTAVAQMDAGTESIRGAQRRVNRALGRDNDESISRQPASRPTAAPKYGGNRRKHLQQIEALIVTISGAAAAFEDVEALDASITSEEATRLMGDLSEQIRQIKRISNLLKECTK